jgi:hypothetical protein
MNITEELSIQLYSLRYFGDLARQLEALAEIGFRRVELTGAHLIDANGTRALLDAHGITAPTAHVSMPDLRGRLGWVADQAKTIGIVELFMPAIPVEERGMSAEGLARGRHRIGRHRREAGASGAKTGLPQP